MYTYFWNDNKTVLTKYDIRNQLQQNWRQPIKLYKKTADSKTGDREHVILWPVFKYPSYLLQALFEAPTSIKQTSWGPPFSTGSPI